MPVSPSPTDRAERLAQLQARMLVTGGVFTAAERRLVAMAVAMHGSSSTASLDAALGLLYQRMAWDEDVIVEDSWTEIEAGRSLE